MNRVRGRVTERPRAAFIQVRSSSHVLQRVVSARQVGAVGARGLGEVESKGWLPLGFYSIFPAKGVQVIAAIIRRPLAIGTSPSEAISDCLQAFQVT